MPWSRRCTQSLVMLVIIAIVAMSGGRNARADGPDESPEKTAQAREEYTRGNELGKKEEWAEALAAFQRSYALRPHPTTRYNIATCLRVLGEYTAARALFEDVLRPGSVEKMPAVLVENARGFRDELDRIIAHVVLTIYPPEAEIVIDGKPLEPTALRGEGGMPILIAGTLPSGRGSAPPAATCEVLVNPGTHVIILSRKGHKDIARTERFNTGARMNLRLDLERLPAVLHITANVDSPIVTVNGVDVGQAPIDISRVPGRYRVVVSKEGYVAHEAVFSVEAGEVPKLDAALVPETVPITKRWWFWAGALAIVAGGVAITYAATRPEPQPPEYQRGNTGWLVELGR